jgi:hypothetical protein
MHDTTHQNPNQTPPGAEAGRSDELRPLLARALAAAAAWVVFAGVVGGVTLSAATALLPRDRLAFFGLGIGAALLATALALLVHGRLLDRRRDAVFAGDGRLMAGRLQGLLGAAFAVKLSALVLGMLALRQSGAKFEDTATFGVTFVGAALVAQLGATASLARGLQRAPARAVANPPHFPGS